MHTLEPLVIDPDTFLYKHCALPSLPRVLTEFQEIMNSLSADATEIAGLIKNDPALVAQLIKIANSAYYSLPMEIAEIKTVIAYLGINEVYRVILSVSVINTLSTDQKDEFNNIWLHSLLTAFCTKYFAKKFEPLLDRDELWTIAILHDIGKLVYLKFFPEHYQAIQNYSKKNGCLFSEAEVALSLPPSSYLGTLLCERWRLPDKVKKVCFSHSFHDLNKLNKDDPKSSYELMVILGNMAALLSTDKVQQEKRSQIIEAILKTINIDESDFLLIMGDVGALKEEAGKLLF